MFRNSVFSCPATALAAKENIVSVGEDGSIIESSVSSLQTIRKLGADLAIVTFKV